MRYRAILQAQRSRRNLSQQAMQRAHRRCDLIRTTPDQVSTVPVLTVAQEGEGERRDPRITPHHR
ncbi:MAG TPA: hypothetical protein PK880_16025 [Candidatus Competibacter sp.]|nr:hypothetical protein [Candidatus Competibacter sp.]